MAQKTSHSVSLQIITRAARLYDNYCFVRALIYNIDYDISPFDKHHRLFLVILTTDVNPSADVYL